jgi:hypothetical protein
MRKIPTIILLVISAGLYAHKSEPYRFYWHEKGIDVFSSRTAEFTYSEKDMFYYRISNDSDNIYVDIRIFDDEIKQQILRSGLTIWIDPDGKKERKTGVRYPVRFQNRYRNTMADSLNRDVPENMKSRYPVNVHQAWSWNGDSPGAPAGTLMLIGFSESGPVLVTDFTGNNFRGAIAFQKGANMLDYEVVMPFSKLPFSFTAPAGKKSRMMLGFSYESSGSAGKGRPYGGGGGGYHSGGHGTYGGGGMHGGGGGMYGGGGMHGGGGRHGGSPGNGGYSSGGGESLKIFWIKDASLAEFRQPRG